jgi:hypothetical protein
MQRMVTSIAVFKAESNAPIGLHCYGPSFFSFAFQFVESKSWDIHVFNGPGLSKLGQDKSQTIGMLCLDSRQTSAKEGYFQSLMSKTIYHV